MKIPRLARPESATTEEPGRYAMHQLRLDGDYLVATNGRILSMLKIERHPEDRDGYVTPLAMQRARAVKRHNADAPHKADMEHSTVLIANGGFILADGTQMKREDDAVIGEFPRYKAVLPDKDETAVRFTLDAALLFDLAKAIGANTGDGTYFVTVQVPEKDREGKYSSPFRIESKNGHGAIMPVRPDA